ncbi:hypothetical protein [Mucilaginibacter sp. KACC 22063]|uniref:hypothetical protein n=1 Tax=Mucilaginibacter sp. KACC 22063 TaxID=3025666 RepID=UPI0023664E79|nr:hypothetical protein [Mucilaginibacter sp. KACC 22063]WDF55768.1 hypothetical protein PQ461_01670 [Mucilaginibacter sp. KACC 22063]
MKQQSALLPKAQKVLNDLGENIKLARLRRKLSTAQILERAGISRATYGKSKRARQLWPWELISKCYLLWDWKKIS